MRLVFVEWLDSCRGDGWESLKVKKKEPLKCFSVGWLISDDRDQKTLMPHIDAEETQGCGRMTIPTSSIIRMDDIDLPKFQGEGK